MQGVIWQSLITLGGSIFGFCSAMILQAAQASRENQREHYYKTREKTEDIFARCASLSDTVYQFHQRSVALAVASRPDETLITDFITKYNSQLSSIYMSQKIFFPGVKIDTNPLLRSADALVAAVRGMWKLSTGRASLEEQEFARRASQNMSDRSSAIDLFARELGVVLNVMAVSLNKTAAKLRIRAEPVKIDRNDLPPAPGVPVDNTTIS